MHTELRSLGFGYAHDYYPEGKHTMMYGGSGTWLGIIAGRTYG